MVGLPNHNNKIRVLTQWHQLFVSQSIHRSSQAYAHWQKVEGLGLPNSKHENWKYTPLNGLLAHRFIAATARQVSESQRDDLSLSLNAFRLVFVDGCFTPALSDNNTGFWQIEVERGANRQTLPDPIQPEVFLHLTESLSLETTRIFLPPGKSEARPLYLLHISQGAKDEKTLTTLHYRHHIEMAAGAKGQVIEHFVSLNQGHFSGARTSIAVSDNAQLNYIKLAFESRASYHFSHNDMLVGRNAMVHNSIFICGSALTRHQTSVQLNGEGADLSINSLLLPSIQDITDIRTYLEHNQGYCLSRQLHKVIARDRGKGVFNGLIKVGKDALKTDGKMINNNLLLDRLAEVNTKPQLEIYADDVKCSHGATVGRIDKEQIFYLRSRGIARQDAQKMIIYAFAAEVMEEIDNGVIRDTVLARIFDALEGAVI